MTVVWFKFCVYILLPITIVLVVLKALTGCHIRAFKLDNHSVWSDFLLVAWNVDFVVKKDIIAILLNETSIDRQ